MTDPDPRNPDEQDLEAPEDDAAEQREPVAESDDADTEDGALPVEVDAGDLAEQHREAIPAGADEEDYR